jgi:hypothetical protein
MSTYTIESHLIGRLQVMSDSDDETQVDIVDKSKQLQREVFSPMRHNQKRDQGVRPLYGYNFRPQSTPNGNHLIVDRESKRKKIEVEFASTIVEQQMLLQQSVIVSDADWRLLASYLSPKLLHKCKPPLHPNTCMKISKLACPFEIPCWCIACAGIHTKPCIASCMVCAAIIPYSVCIKTAVTTPPSQLPSMCFACRCAFGE